MTEQDENQAAQLVRQKVKAQMGAQIQSVTEFEADLRAHYGLSKAGARAMAHAAWPVFRKVVHGASEAEIEDVSPELTAADVDSDAVLAALDQLAQRVGAR